MRKHSEATHTPGPWQAMPCRPENPGVNGYVTAIGKGHIAEVFGRYASSIRPADEGNANARLIAAAPDLLAAVDMVLEADGDLNAIDFDMLRAAIAKARGT